MFTQSEYSTIVRSIMSAQSERLEAAKRIGREAESAQQQATSFAESVRYGRINLSMAIEDAANCRARGAYGSYGHSRPSAVQYGLESLMRNQQDMREWVERAAEARVIAASK